MWSRSRRLLSHSKGLLPARKREISRRPPTKGNNNVVAVAVAAEVTDHVVAMANAVPTDLVVMANADPVVMANTDHVVMVNAVVTEAVEEEAAAEVAKRVAEVAKRVAEVVKRVAIAQQPVEATT